jgi:hypothetical protein
MYRLMRIYAEYMKYKNIQNHAWVGRREENGEM